MQISSNKIKNYNKICFKGIPQAAMKAISGAMDGNKFLTSYSQSFDINKTLSVIRKNIGSSADVLYEHVMGDEIIRQGVVKTGENLQFKNKKFSRLLINGLLYPIAKIPFHILYGTLRKLKKFRTIANSNWLKNFEQSSFYKATHSYLKKDDKLNALKGLMEIGARTNITGNNAIEKAFVINTAKTFDPKCGNYNGVIERALTRIVTGFIPAFFLANDAHNLSILCNNNKKEAQTEKSLRFKQETKRVLSNAYIQLITLGALSKFINRSKAWFVGVTMATVTFTEIYSRLSTGKKIHFISSKEAKEINAKERMKKTQDNMDKGLTFVVDESPTALNVKLDGVNKFTKDAEFNKFKALDIKNNNKKQKTSNNNKTPSRAILSFATLGKYYAAILAAGIMLAFTRKRIPQLDNLFKNIAKGYSNIYSKLTTKPNHFLKSDMSKIFEKMTNCGFETLAKSYEKVIMDYQKISVMPKFINKEIIDTIRKSGNIRLANYLEEFVSGKNSKKLLSNLRNDSIEKNIKKFIEYLQNSGQTDLAGKISEINADGKINYPKLHKLFSKTENLKYFNEFENIFMVDDNSLKKELLENTKKVLEDIKMDNLWKKAESNALSEINTRGYLDLGPTKKPYIKEIVDFCIEPFKFIWTCATLSYKGYDNFIKMLKVVPQKPTNNVDAVAKALNSLSKKIKMDDKTFTDMFNEKIVKGFNTATMSKIANSELSAIAKTASTATTMSFLMSDNYNMVMLKSDGEDIEEAKLKRKERAVQEISRLFWQQLFINLFNNTFSSAYNASLLGASAVNTASTTIGEICTRKAVGLPLNAASKEEIIDLEKRNLSGNGIKSKFFRFMSKLTGKQILSERENIKAKNK